MALARVKNWVDGNVLTAGDLNAEFNNILTNPISLISPTTGSINTAGNQTLGLRLENTAAPGNTQLGALYLYTPYKSVLMGNGAGGFATLGPHQSLSRVSNLGGSLISNIGSFAAAGYQCISGGSAYANQSLTVSATSSFSVNTQTVGPAVNGRDQAAAFAGTEVHFYAITTGLGSTTIAGIVSTNPPPTGPTLTGLNQQWWAYLCSAKYDAASSAITPSSLVSGSQVILLSPAGLISVSSTGSGLTSAATPPGSYAPSQATKMILESRIGGAYNSTGELDVNFGITPSSSQPVTQALAYIAQGPSSTGQTMQQQGPNFMLPVIQSSPLLYYNLTVNIGLTGTLIINLQGYTVANGDN